MQNKERTEVQSQIYMKLFYSITSCVIGEVPLIDLPFVMIILQAYNRIAHQGEWVPRTLLSKHFVSSLVSRSLSQWNICILKQISLKTFQFCVKKGLVLSRENPLLILLIFILWHKIFHQLKAWKIQFGNDVNNFLLYKRVNFTQSYDF